MGDNLARWLKHMRSYKDEERWAWPGEKKRGVAEISRGLFGVEGRSKARKIRCCST